MEEITLSDGRKVAKRKVKVRDLANAEMQAKGKEHLIKYAIIGAKILIDGKPAILEDVLDMDEDDMVLIGELFTDDSPNV
jgi:hypothetical protein